MLEIREKKVKTVEEPKNKMLHHEVEPNPSKDKSMHEGDNPSFSYTYMYTKIPVFSHNQ
jgi:hypothetical protein